MHKTVLRIALISLLLCPTIQAQTRPNRVVLGYSASWRDNVDAVEDYNYAGITHLARSFLHPNPDGSIQVPPDYFNPSMEQLARAHGVKLLMSAGGEADRADNWVSIATHPDFLKRYLDSAEKLLNQNHYDGFDIDWEPAPLTTAEGDAYVVFLKALRSRFPNVIITTALPAGEYWISHFSWAEVIACVDFVNVMTYDYAGGWGGVAGHGSNLFPAAEYRGDPGNSAAEGMQNLLQNHHLPASKLLMGMTFWGYRFRADQIGDHFPANTPGFADGLTYAQTMDLLGTGHYLSLWDQGASMPYLQRIGGGSVICYENAESIRRKCEYAKQIGVAGVMIWHVGADVSGKQAPLMDAVTRVCGGGAAILSDDALELQIAEITHGNSQPPPATTPAVSADDVQSKLASLRFNAGIENDRRWQSKTSPSATN